MNGTEAKPEQKDVLERVGWVLALLLLALRFFHLGGPLDDPHSWRQADTARASLEYARHGIDLLHPVVCWLGGHRILIFEFPLPEAMSALLQRTFGGGVVWDRVVDLAFYVVATVYLHAFVRLAAGARTAWIATLAWLAFPLGQFYSRAAHVDFAATAGAHALLYHGARTVRGGGWKHAAGAALAGVLAALIKAPYLIPLLGPLALVALSATAPAAVGGLAAALAITAVAFKLWRRHVDATNAQAPDWFFLPGYYKEVNPLWWYFGDWHQRFDRYAWWKIVHRLLTEVFTPPGVLLLFAAPLAAVRATMLRFGLRAITLAWCAGTLVYLLVFFPLNVIHNYYQIPFLAPAALLLALGFEAMWTRMRPAAVILFVLFLTMALIAPRKLSYYQVDWLRVEAGQEIDRRLPKGDLVIACDHASEYSDPRLLQRADRDGWSVAIPDLTPTLVAKLVAAGAKHVAIVTDPEHPALRAPDFLAAALTQRVAIHHLPILLGSVGGVPDTLGTLSLYDLPVPGAAAADSTGSPPR